MKQKPLGSKFISICSAGKSSLIGNIFTVSITFSAHDIATLKTIGIENCESFNKHQIEDKATKILESFDFWVEETTPREIDLYNAYNMEAKTYTTCFSHVKSKMDTVFAENFDFSSQDMTKRLSKFSREPIDFSFWIIGRDLQKTCSISKAAYILAKFYRNCHINDLQEEYGDIGSGCLGDKKTEDYIINSLKNEWLDPLIRYKYNEIERLKNVI